MYKVVSFPSAFLTSPQQNSHPQNTFRQSTNLAPEARINSEDLGADKSSAEQSGVPVVGLTLTQLRILYPAYDDLSDDELSDGIYKKFYAGQDRAKIKRLYGFWPSK